MVSQFPILTKEEFKQGCQDLERRYLNSQNHTDLETANFNGECLYITQKRLHPGERQETADADFHANFVELDMEALQRYSYPVSAPFVTVNFSVALSPTYQIPVLWFTLSQGNMLITSLDKMYEIIVAHDYQDTLRQVGVIGGISIADHPFKNIPAFFIHPCRTHEILELIRPDTMLSSVEYLLLWLGAIGPAVGLYVPAVLATGESENDFPRYPE